MQDLRTERPTQNQVMAVFALNPLSFDLPRSATLEDLAGRLAHLSKRHGRALTSVSVRVSAQMRADPSGGALLLGSQAMDRAGDEARATWPRKRPMHSARTAADCPELSKGGVR